jgi:hypothetical protein
MKSGWKIYKGVRIFHFDLSDLGANDQAIMTECDAADAVIMAEPSNSVLILNDVRGTTGSSMEVIKHLQLSAERSSPYIAKAAVIGVTGAKVFALDLVNLFSRRPIIHFNDFESAADFLIAGLIEK